MARLLFTCRPLSGHFDPILPLAEAARSAGHVVGFASGDPVVGRARDAGFESFAAGPPDTFRAEWAPRFPRFRELVGDEQRAFFFTEIFADLELEPRARDLESVVEAWQPDLVLHEMAELAAPLVCTRAGVPYVDIGYGPLIPDALLRAAGAAAAPHWRVRGLDPHPRAGLFDHLYVDPCPPSLQAPAIAGLTSVQSMRPSTGAVTTPDPLVADPPTWLRDLTGRPLVYVTMGTIWNTDLDLFRLLIGSLAPLVDLIVTVGRQNDPDALGPQPAGVVVRRFIPQHEILAHCAAVVTHGGAGTTIGALAAGMPLLVLPRGADQWANAEMVVTAGAGLRLLDDELSAAAVQDAIEALLGRPSFRNAAMRVQAEISVMPDLPEVVAAIEALL